MLFVRCPFCHKRILKSLYLRHRRSHTKLLSDGQMTEHVTLHPSGRYTGSLAGVPRSYFHAKCGRGTGMPEEIVRSYLVNPFLYNNKTFCCGCNGYIDRSEMTWVETGQNLAVYFKALQADYVRRHGSPPPKVKM